MFLGKYVKRKSKFKGFKTMLKDKLVRVSQKLNSKGAKLTSNSKNCIHLEHFNRSTFPKT